MKIATFDIETNALELEDITTIHCAAIVDHDTGECFSFTSETVQELPRKLECYTAICGHNCIAYDLPAIRKILHWEYKGTIIDTLIMSRMQRPNREGGHSVANWGRILGQHKLEHNEWDKFSPEMLERCVQDAQIQHRIYQELLKEAEYDEKQGFSWDLCHRLNMKLFTYLQMQEERGWHVDREHIEHCLRTLERWKQRIERAIVPRLPYVCEPLEQKLAGEYNYVKKPFLKNGRYAKITEDFLSGRNERGGDDTVVGPFTRVSFRPIDLNKPQELKDYLLNLGWEPNEWNKDKDGRRTSPKLSKDDEFIGVSGKIGKLLVRYVQCKQRGGTINGWKESIRSDGKVAPKHSGLAVTGRLKHSVIVNVPNPETKSFFAKQMRQLFCAQPGWVMIGVDSAGNQIRQLAARMGDDDFTNSVLFGSKEDGTDLHSLNQKRAKTSTRTTAKNFFYGLIFGASNRKLSKYGNATREEFFAELPKMQELLQRLRTEWRQTAQRVYNKQWRRHEYRDGFIKGLDGRPIQVETEHKLLNYVLQSDEAIQMGAAYVWFFHQVEKRGYEWGKDWGMLIWYHDEYQFECRPDIVSELSELAEESIAWAGRYYKIPVPHEGEAKIGLNWKETH